MEPKTLKVDFGQFIFLDDHTIIAEANEGMSIDGNKVKYAIDLIEKEILGDYALILDRKADYSIVPVEIYQFFASLKRLRAIAIVKHRDRDFLPNNMEKKIYKKNIEKFNSVNEAHEWIKKLF